jgi:GNAT superfamily N-acetyltransferase
MNVAPMTRADATEVSELLQTSYALLQEREGLSQEQTDFLKSARGSLESVLRESRLQHYMVARHAGRIVGVVAVSGELITKLYVAPEHIGMGVGRLLYEAAESWIRAQGLSRVTLGAFPTAVPFYKEMGLEVVGEKRPCGALSGLTLLLMEKSLDRGNGD